MQEEIRVIPFREPYILYRKQKLKNIKNKMKAKSVFGKFSKFLMRYTDGLSGIIGATIVSIIFKNPK